MRIFDEYNHLTRNGRTLTGAEVKSLIRVATEDPHTPPRGMFEHGRTRVPVRSHWAANCFCDRVAIVDHGRVIALGSRTLPAFSARRTSSARSSRACSTIFLVSRQSFGLTCAHKTPLPDRTAAPSLTTSPISRQAISSSLSLRWPRCSSRAVGCWWRIVRQRACL